MFWIALENKILDIINRVIGNIDQLTLKKINEIIDLPLDQLIAPRINHRRGQQIPRPQNSFLLYRRNLNAFINKRNVRSDLNFISKEAAKNWSNESYEIKHLYELLADYAKQVHNIVYPNYSYKPKRKNCFKLQFPLVKVDSQKKIYVPQVLFPPIVDEYDKNVWSLVDKHSTLIDFFIQSDLYSNE
ncbi:2023_t:CDS:2 [Gigaspora margarita]|uniref:2023_t:CDS:1 n=1 Tax=Gigaspora margarita TaxID=4874 RepID=A0ABM8VVD5_GIGMA|nr:2023_t:CDS:2 [Gigaspora margarita]